ncbi:type II toxin-antitoxin system RelE/ParE family toxin [Mucilaginibacter arboris]|uniref:Type II toxin-antitoxin system RelE/ParE family toxin n=1 Tax=Mucilaginibacter arboris TaxID=2682090 RepID=A0A7K1SVA7_9SPHI|nr:type II toxin-antitoxin system RelE/ParE family toxin [Mucilaginibacter arboris]MVN21255.1 type II toxin-antitoxin system RelE/ParE family toxin [Mucilaginibacter arboris]
MAATVIYTRTARIDLQEIFTFISKNSLRYAQKEINEIRQEVKKLKSNLYLGHQFYEKGDELTREIVYKNYRIIYNISSNYTKIQILTIHHHARLLSNNPGLDDNDDE